MSEFCILVERVEFNRVGRRDLQVLTTTEKQDVHTYIYPCHDLLLVMSSCIKRDSNDMFVIALELNRMK